ncbi:hypothetical protein H0H92_008130 [Tricholoma furcatifolium]|nr:hypothetical protein H0H92_008130 [Tricholoma furcatifolium]
MKFNVIAPFLSLVGLAAASAIQRCQTCAEASRFGNIGVSPDVVNPGDNITITVDLSCSSCYGIEPRYLDYTIQVPPDSNNGHEPNIVLARRNVAAGATSDKFTVQVPEYYYFAGAPYEVVLTNTYSTTSSPVLVQGGIASGLTINVNNN